MPVKSLASRMGPNDLHIVVNGETQKAVVYRKDGSVVFSCPARCFGQHADWTRPNGDTPPGVYRCGTIYDTRGEAPYGRWCLDLEDLEGQETGNGRAGISLHGGGSGLADPFAPYQGWQATHGCIRVQNADLERLVALIRSARVAYLQVYYPLGHLA